MTPHLTHDQLCDLLIAPATPTPGEAGHLEMLREHLNVCQQCSTELSSLGQSLATFRSMTTAWTAHLWNRQPASPAHPLRSGTPARVLTLPALWTAAAAIVVAVMITFSAHQNKPAPAAHTTAANATSSAATAETPTIASDEALLEEVDATLSSSVPSPMQPLDDPTAGLHSLNKQRKN